MKQHFKIKIDELSGLLLSVVPLALLAIQLFWQVQLTIIYLVYLAIRYLVYLTIRYLVCIVLLLYLPCRVFMKSMILISSIANKPNSLQKSEWEKYQNTAIRYVFGNCWMGSIYSVMLVI